MRQHVASEYVEVAWPVAYFAHRFDEPHRTAPSVAPHFPERLATSRTVL